ncbi:MAG: CRISPR-associated protein Cmr3 [Leptolyngbyaceae cyanobacterium RM1_1_2]|nr:CRISPR-associated protein Cmr3 [Leptolyngbyaceae cyanobacterium RM1_1_2]
MTATAPDPSVPDSSLSPFAHLIAIHPLGLLYGSAGPFLSPENLVGQAGASFPPQAATVSGMFAAQYGNKSVQSLQLAGPFWAKTETVTHNENQDFYVPTPMTCLVKKGENTISNTLNWQEKDGRSSWRDRNGEIPTGKFESGTWLSLKNWNSFHLQQVSGVGKDKPWKFVPHLHPRLELDQRRVAAGRAELGPEETNQGSLFLENAVQLNSDCCLVYLSSQELPPGWYRFGGEGHMVEVTCHPLQDHIRRDLLSPPSLGRALATITPAVWGSNRLSQRYPEAWRDLVTLSDSSCVGVKESILTAKPIPFRYRLGNRKDDQGQDIHQPHQPKLLSRGRYGVPAGSVYVLKDPLDQPWHLWPPQWFPKEGPYMNRWGCGLALALPSAIA